MKTGRFLGIIICLILCMGSVTAVAQSKQSKKQEKENAIKKLVESGNYTIDVTIANPQRGKSIMLTSPYSLEVRNDSVISHLPFYGRAYSIPYGGGDGLIFKAPLDEYNAVYNDKKKRLQVKMKAKTSEDTFEFNFDIYYNGSSRINVNMQNRESISYSGEIDLLPL